MTGQPQEVRILIADGYAMFRDSLRHLLEQEPTFRVVGEARDGREAVDRVEKLAPDLLLLSQSLPRMSGLAVLQALRSNSAGTRKILVSSGIENKTVVEALRLGAHGILQKDTDTHLLFKSIHTVMNGQYWVCHKCVAGLIDFLRDSPHQENPRPGNGCRLSPRELQVANAIVDGFTNRDIARKFSLSEQTVKHHLTKIFAKTGVANRLELALYAMHNGFSA